MPTTDSRTYPTHCTSAYCGRTECEGCPLLPALQEFKAWRERTRATVADPIWSPTVYHATTTD